jgi:hypothetical protein
MENCICGNPKKPVKNCKNVFTKTCGNKDCVLKLRQSTNLVKYGHISNLHGEIGKNQVLKTLKEKYGENIENVSQISDIKQKKVQTCRNNFGVDYPMQSLEVINKSKETIIKKYGVDNVSKSKEIIEKIRNRMYEIDPDTGLTILETSSLKREQTYLEKFGFKYYFQTEEFKEKYKSKMIKLYGSDNYFSSDEFFKIVGRSRVENKTEFYKYRQRVKSITEKVFKKNFDLISNLFFRGKEYHLDHIYSVYDGFINNVEPEIISSLPNLQLIKKSVNLKKSSTSWQSLEQLLYLYNKLNSKI